MCNVKQINSDGERTNYMSSAGLLGIPIVTSTGVTAGSTANMILVDDNANLVVELT